LFLLQILLVILFLGSEVKKRTTEQNKKYLENRKLKRKGLKGAPITEDSALGASLIYDKDILPNEDSSSAGGAPSLPADSADSATADEFVDTNDGPEVHADGASDESSDSSSDGDEELERDDLYEEAAGWDDVCSPEALFFFFDVGTCSDQASPSGASAAYSTAQPGATRPKKGHALMEEAVKLELDATLGKKIPVK
jgi:hypothetical protein